MSDKLFDNNTQYESLCLILGGGDLIEPGTVMSGLEWRKKLIFEVSERCFWDIFKIWEEPKRQVQCREWFIYMAEDGSIRVPALPPINEKTRERVECTRVIEPLAYDVVQDELFGIPFLTKNNSEIMDKLQKMGLILEEEK